MGSVPHEQGVPYVEALFRHHAAALCVLNLTVGSAFSADLVKVPTAWLDEHETFLMWYAKEKAGTRKPGSTSR